MQLCNRRYGCRKRAGCRCIKQLEKQKLSVGVVLETAEKYGKEGLEWLVSKSKLGLTDDLVRKLLKVDDLGLLTDDVIRAIKNSNGYADEIIEQIIKYGKDAATAIGTYGDEAAELIRDYGEDAVRYFRDGKSLDQVLEETYGKELKQKAHQLIEDKIINTPGGKGKSIIVCAYDIRTQKIVSERNTVGACAEFHAINSLLLNGCNIEDIRLTEAIRPRTGEIRPYCDNCKEMFNDIINRGGGNK